MCRRKVGVGWPGPWPVPEHPPPTLPLGPHLSEEGPIEGDSVEAVDCPHVDVQVHEQTLLLL